MLGYFYLLCLLVCIQWSFCYDISEHRPVRRRAKEMRVKRQRHSDLVRKAYEMDDKDLLAHIDVASFLQQPDYEAAMTNYYKPRYTDGKTKESNLDNLIALGSINGMNLHLPQIHKQRTENTGNKRIAPGESVNTDEELRKVRLDKRANTHDKKCSIKHMKFPFFSHKKTVTPNSKKTKKKKTCVTTTSLPVLQTSLAKPVGVPLFSDNDKIMKRSYEETFCPLCKRKLGPKRGNSEIKKKNKMIHNSRQFYQNVEEGAKAVPNIDIQNAVIERKNLDAETPGSNRWRRHENCDERDKNFRELEDLQNKIESMGMNKLDLTPEIKENDKNKEKDKDKDKEEMR